MTEHLKLPDAVARMLAIAQAQRGQNAGVVIEGEASALKGRSAHEAITAVGKDDPVDPAILAECAELDHSDTDNAKRLRLHFGQDLLVIAQEKAKQPLFAVWTGTHWDVANGGPKSLAIAQKLGDRIALEAEYLKMIPSEQEAYDAGKDYLDIEPSFRTPGQKFVAEAAEGALDALNKRKSARAKHAVTSKNSGRMKSALECAAPHLLVSPDDMNADKYMFAARNATLRFDLTMSRRKNARFVSLEETPDAAEYIDYCSAFSLKVHPGHRREDKITSVIPVDYDSAAKCPRWDRFIETKLPDPAVRRLVQVSSGLSLLGITVQYLFFHYGSGANGKSVYMETICRLLGSASVTLPSTSIVGEGSSSGGASPDIVRLYGRRMLRVKELPEGEPLRENLVKELTGGETVTARDLFNGYIDFEPQFIAMMSGNGYPKITGTDEGIWRRMAVILWPKQIAVEDRRDFQEVLADFEPEYSGILNWLIEGVNIYLREGLVIPEAVRKATQEYRDDMDRTAAFVARCIVRNPDAPPVQGKLLYQAYCNFTIDQGGKPMNNTAFGREMSRKFEKDKSSGIVLYFGIQLVNVPDAQDTNRPPPADYEDFLP
jgi:putative DNA primase/helicase